MEEVRGNKLCETSKQISGRYIADLKEIPLGSVHGLILFLLYKNDLSVNIQQAKSVLFASDTNIQIKAANEDFLNKKINGVKQKLLI